jgi:hypothetical protein
MVDNQVAPDLHNPTLQAAGFRTKAFKILINPDKYILRQIFCFVPATSVTIGKIVNTLGVRIHNRLPGGVISTETALHDFFITWEQCVNSLSPDPVNEGDSGKVQKILGSPNPGILEGLCRESMQLMNLLRPILLFLKGFCNTECDWLWMYARTSTAFLLDLWRDFIFIL